MGKEVGAQMKQTGTIVSVDDRTGFCTLRFPRESACEGCHAPCHQGGGCITGLTTTPPITLTVENTLSKRVGDQATVATRGGNVIFLTAVLYLLPAVFAIIAYCLCANRFGSRMGIVAFFVVLVILFAAAVWGCTTLCRRMIRYEMIA